MKTAVLVSGGVDSSVALRLLQEQGHTVTAFYLKIWLEDELSFLGTCPWEEDLAYVRAVCDQAQVPLEIISLQKEYWSEVVSYSISEIKAGRTPNPDILCNKRIKFGAFYKYIDPSFNYIATGHYAQRKEVDQNVLLFRAPDTIKDQTYFLSHIQQHQLKRALFPIGHLQKADVRAYAQRYNLPNKERKDSQGICFLGKLKFADFVNHYFGQQEGYLIEFETKKVLGTHKGFWYYTIGQRHGIGLSGGPWYVVSKDVNTNQVYISRNYYTDEKVRDTFEISLCNWIVKEPLSGKELQVKMRHGAFLNNCVINQIGLDRFNVKLAQRDQGLAPGQFAVFYDQEECIGSGVIT
jgi:tRNA-5-taurinomethyluridine 2-sulfurtransferase